MSGKRKKSTCFMSEQILDEGMLPVPSRKKKKRHDRSHKDDEKERRKAIAEEFDELKLYLPEEKRCKARQELLGNIRELVWELWRNQEIIQLSRSDILASKVCELEKHIVMKRDKRRKLQEIIDSGTQGNMMMGVDYPPPMGQEDGGMTTSTCRYIESEERAEILSPERAKILSQEHAEILSQEHAEILSQEHAEILSQEHAEILSQEHAEILSQETLSLERAEILSQELHDTSEPEFTMEIEEYEEKEMIPSDIFYHLQSLVDKQDYPGQDAGFTEPKIEYLEEEEVHNIGVPGSQPCRVPGSQPYLEEEEEDEAKYATAYMEAEAESIIRDTYSVVGINHAEGDSDPGEAAHHQGDCQSVLGLDDDGYLEQGDDDNTAEIAGDCSFVGRSQDDGVYGTVDYNLNTVDEDSSDRLNRDMLEDMFMKMPPVPLPLPHMSLYPNMMSCVMPWAAPFQVPIPMGGGYQFAVPMCLPPVNNGTDSCSAGADSSASAESSAAADTTVPSADNDRTSVQCNSSSPLKSSLDQLCDGVLHETPELSTNVDVVN